MSLKRRVFCLIVPPLALAVPFILMRLNWWSHWSEEDSRPVAHEYELVSTFKGVTTETLSTRSSEFQSELPSLVHNVFSSGNEVTSVLYRLDTCLLTANLSGYFKSMGYKEQARDNAKHFLTVLRNVVPKTFKANFTSPCWETRFQVVYRAMSDVISTRLGNLKFLSDVSNTFHDQISTFLKMIHGKFSSDMACLPKILLAGFPKCGSTFLYCMITRGLGYEAQVTKEPRWWVPAGSATSPHVPTAEDVPVYLMQFAPALSLKNSHAAITIDASPNLFFDWPRFTTEEPPVNYCLLPAVIPQVLPHSKFVVIMRNPVTMLYSSFWFSCTTFGIRVPTLKGPDIFHERVVAKINQFNLCMRTNSLEWCVINITYNLFSPELQKCGRTQLGMGIYYVHIRKWLSVFPRENFLFLSLEELSTSQLSNVAKKLAKFVGVDVHFKMSNFGCYKNEQVLVDYHHDLRLQMRNDTEELLKEFYWPFNQRLVDLTGDKKFLWVDV